MEMTFKVPDKLGQELQQRADVDDFVAKALDKALLEEWQDEQTEISIAQADRGEFASDEEVEAFFNKWKANEEK